MREALHRPRGLLPDPRPVPSGLDKPKGVHGVQYLSIRYAASPRPASWPSVGSVGDSYDDALAETVIGLFKGEIIHGLGPWRTREAVLRPTRL